MSEFETLAAKAPAFPTECDHGVSLRFLCRVCRCTTHHGCDCREWAIAEVKRFREEGGYAAERNIEPLVAALRALVEANDRNSMMLVTAALVQARAALAALEGGSA